MEELKPCPHCGKSDALFLGSADQVLENTELAEDQFAVICDAQKGGCGACGSFAENEEEAATAWNRRAAPENKALTLEQVVKKRGEPLWYQPVKGGEDTPFDNDPAWFICNLDRLPEPFYLYGKTWLAYAHKPEQEATP